MIGSTFWSLPVAWGLAAPVLGTLSLHGRGAAAPLVAHAVEWLVTCLAIGLLSAFAWHRYA